MGLSVGILIALFTLTIFVLLMIIIIFINDIESKVIDLKSRQRKIYELIIDAETRIRTDIDQFQNQTIEMAKNSSNNTPEYENTQE